MLLQRGDCVAIVATARKITADEIESAVGLLESWGLHVRIPEGLFASCHQFAGDDSHRAMLLQRQLDDPEVKAIFCARGGYGTVRILDRIDLRSFIKHPKWLVGYSDVTAMHSHLITHTSIPSVHGTMPINITNDAVQTGRCPALDSMYDILFNGHLNIAYSVSDWHGPVFCRPGECQARLIGGNLSVLYSLLGSDSDADTVGKVLLLEDVDEYLYHIDRMMMALKRAGKLRGLAGLLIGRFSDMHDNQAPFGKSASQIVFDAVAEYDYPVADCFPVGHVGMNNVAVPLNSLVYLKVSDNEVVMRWPT